MHVLVSQNMYSNILDAIFDYIYYIHYIHKPKVISNLKKSAPQPLRRREDRPEPLQRLLLDTASAFTRFVRRFQRAVLARSLRLAPRAPFRAPLFGEELKAHDRGIPVAAGLAVEPKAAHLAEGDATRFQEVPDAGARCVLHLRDHLHLLLYTITWHNIV